MNPFRNPFLTTVLIAGLLAMTAHASSAEVDSAETPSVATAAALLRAGKLDAALVAIDQLIKSDPRDISAHILRAQIQSALGKHDKAVDDYSEAIRLAPDQDELYYWRGRENFKADRMTASVADFDQYVRRQPKQASRQWERGIALYYANRHKEGADQFVLYQTYHENDVENSVWRFLCQATVDGRAAARKAILPIRNDRRVPMMGIYEMFRGNRQPKEVLAAAKVGDPSDAQLHQRLFYAHLYVGLFYESEGKGDLAQKHVTLAAEKYPIEHYMSDVARVHALRLKSAAEKNSSGENSKPER